LLDVIVNLLLLIVGNSLSMYDVGMTRRIVDLSADELEKLAGDAWNVAAQEALANGHSVTGSAKGRRFRYYPDGRIEDLGPVAAPPDQESDGVKNVAKRR
jgi:hypothetical protein